MSRFVTSNSTYGSYTRSGKTIDRINNSNAMEVESKSPAKIMMTRGSHMTRSQLTDADRPEGLANLKNTCYINSVLQILFELIQLPTSKKSIAKALSDVKQSHSQQDVRQFKIEVEKRLEFVRGFNQQDAQQFLHGLLELLNQEYKVNKAVKLSSYEVNHKMSIKDNWVAFMKYMEKQDNSLIISNFSGENYVELRCQMGHSKYKFEKIMNLTLHFPGRQGIFNLADLIKFYFNDEVIDGVECQQCKKKNRAVRSMSMYNPPKILIVHLNRFHQGEYKNSKINASVKYDQILQLGGKMLHHDHKNKMKYELVGTVNHVGTLNAGHYYAIRKGKTPHSEKWYLCNDEIIRDSSINPVGNMSQFVYILFYQRI